MFSYYYQTLGSTGCTILLEGLSLEFYPFYRESFLGLELSRSFWKGFLEHISAGKVSSELVGRAGGECASVNELLRLHEW